MRIYADNAATTGMSKTAVNAMLPYFDEVYGNPSSLHSAGQAANEAMTAARERIAACLGCDAKEITFTSGGSESDNQAILSAATFGLRKAKNHIITSAFEHHAVLRSCNAVAMQGNPIAFLQPSVQGDIFPESAGCRPPG